MRADVRTFAILLTLLQACGEETQVAAVLPVATAPPANTTAGSSPGPRVPTGDHTVSGEVYSSTEGAIASLVNIWVQAGGTGYSWWWANGGRPPPSDSPGRFTAARIPDSEVTLLAFATGYVQPCAVRRYVSADVHVRIEVMSTALLDSLAPPRPVSAAPPELIGTVYENTPDGRRPIAGANLWVEMYMDVGMATTVSALDGSFYLCNLGADVFIHVSREGFRERWVPVQVEQSLQLDIELERL